MTDVCRWCHVGLLPDGSAGAGSTGGYVCLDPTTRRPVQPVRMHEPTPPPGVVLAERCEPDRWVLVPMRVVRVIPADESFPVTTVTLQTMRWDGDTLIVADGDLCDAVWLNHAPAGHVPPPPPAAQETPVERPVDLMLDMRTDPETKEAGR